MLKHELSFDHTRLASTHSFDELQETGFAHMRICDGVGSYLQLCGLLAKLSIARETAKAP